MAELTLGEVARLAQGELRGDPTEIVRGVAPLERAGSGDLSLVASPRYLSYLHSTRAAAILVAEVIEEELPAGLAQIRVGDPHAALARILPSLYPEEERAIGVHPSAVVEAQVELGEGVSIGAHAVIGRGARIGPRTQIGSQCVVGARCTIGADCLLHPQVTLYPGVEMGSRCTLHSGVRLGVDGFGFAFMEGEHRKIPQIGSCRIEDDVEIGANSTVDRGSIGETVVGKGTKIDNLVHIGHNTRVGRHVIIAAQTGIAGSTVIGDGAMLGGQAGVGGHLTIGAGARIGGQAGVIGDIPAGETVSGYPARPHREAMRASAALFRLPELMRRVRQIEQAVLDGTAPAGRTSERNPSEEQPQDG